tara:strand:- start:1258 stop:1578 length:321 start_codon:yes stop_codon:yes gene_type:complete
LFNNHNPKLTRKEYWDGMPEVHPETGIPSGNIWSSKHEDFIRPDLEKIVKKYTPQAEKNVEVCYTCDSWIASQRRCSECGCFMDVKDIVWKLFARKDRSPCPLNKW